MQTPGVLCNKDMCVLQGGCRPAAGSLPLPLSIHSTLVSRCASQAVSSELSSLPSVIVQGPQGREPSWQCHLTHVAGAPTAAVHACCGLPCL